MNNTYNSKHAQKDASIVRQAVIQDRSPMTVQPHYPNWPTSLPGPFKMQPPPNMRSINALRSEQFAEINYDQMTGEPAEADPPRYHPGQAMEGRTSFDQPTNDV